MTRLFSEDKVDDFEEKMSALERRMQSNFHWTMGILVSMWISIMFTILLNG